MVKGLKIEAEAEVPSSASPPPSAARSRSQSRKGDHGEQAKTDMSPEERKKWAKNYIRKRWRGEDPSWRPAGA
jgi:hypothetical protein